MGFYDNIGATNPVVLERTIHPVGQGAFYSEVFKNEKHHWQIAVVFDCGSENKKSLNKEIVSFNAVCPEIDALFVSHFHADHTNGIEQLKGVKHIFIPRISPSRFIVDYIHNILFDCSENSANRFMERCLPILKGDTEDNESIISVIQLSENFIAIDLTTSYSFWNYSSLLPTDSSLDESAFIEDIRSEIPELKSIIKTHIEWMDISSYKQLADQCQKKEVISKLKIIYKKMFSNHNNYSMLLFSSIRDGFYIIDRQPSSCLYTGDAIISSGMEEKILQLEKSIGIDIIQVPHHGSKHNNCPDVYSKDQIAFVSVGNKNKYNHPSKILLNYLNNHCKGIWKITDFEDTKKTFKSEVYWVPEK